MKCKKCDNEIKKEDRYCGSCGEKVRIEKKKETKKNYFYEFCAIVHRFRRVIILVASCFILLLGSYKVCEYFSSIEYAANKYFKALINNDTATIYESIKEYKNDFVSETLLKEKTKSLENVGDYKIANIQVLYNEAIVTYHYEEDGRLKTTYISLTKSGTKYLMFNNWKVKSGRIVENVTFKIPKNATITIDEKDIKKYLDEEQTDEFYDYYKIDSMIQGKYEVVITLESGIEVKENVNVENESIYSIATLEIEETIENKLEENTKNLLSVMYTSVLENKSADEVTALTNSSLKSFYKDLKYYSTNQISSLKQITFTDVELKNTYFNKEGKLVANFQTEYTYEVSYTYNNEPASYTGVNRGSVSVIFDYDQEYIINSIDNLNNSYPIRK